MFSPDYSQLFADRTLLLAERLSTSTLEPIAQQLISLIIDIISSKGRIAFSPSVFRESGSLRYCPVSMYMTVIALNLADFGLVVVSQRICRFQFICGATIVGCWWRSEGVWAARRIPTATIAAATPANAAAARLVRYHGRSR
jgi:hypothetical protein